MYIYICVHVYTYKFIYNVYHIIRVALVSVTQLRFVPRQNYVHDDLHYLHVHVLHVSQKWWVGQQSVVGLALSRGYSGIINIQVTSLACSLCHLSI